MDATLIKFTFAWRLYIAIHVTFKWTIIEYLPAETVLSDVITTADAFIIIKSAIMLHPTDPKDYYRH